MTFLSARFHSISYFVAASPTVGVIARAISVATDIAVLGFTLKKTAYVFRLNPEVKSFSQLSAALAYNGMMTTIRSSTQKLT